MFSMFNCDLILVISEEGKNFILSFLKWSSYIKKDSCMVFLGMLIWGGEYWKKNYLKFILNCWLFILFIEILYKIF